jgi:hypothetical protein
MKKSTPKRVGAVGAALDQLAGSVSLKATGNTLRAVTQEMALVQQSLEVLSRQPAEAAAASVAKLTARLQELTALKAKLEGPPPFAGPALEGPGAREMPGFRPPVTLRDPFTLPTGAGGTAGKSRHDKMLDDLASAAKRASGSFTSWQAAIESIEHSVRALEPTTPIVAALTAEAEKARVAYSSWGAAAASIEDEIRGPALRAAEAAKRANEAALAAGEAAHAAFVRTGESLAQQFETPAERLRRLRAELEQLSMVLDERFQPGIERAMAAAQEEFARTTAAGQAIVMVGDSITSAFDQSFAGVIQGTLTLEAAWRNMAQSIILEINKIIIRTAVLKAVQLGLRFIGGGAGSAAGALASGSTEMLMQHGGLVQGSRSAPPDSIVGRLSAGEYVVRRQAVDRLGVDVLDRLNALPRFQQGGPALPMPATPGVAMTRQGTTQAPVVNLDVIIVKSDQEAQAKRAELEALNNHIVRVVSKNMLAGDGSEINRTLRLVHQTQGR